MIDTSSYVNRKRPEEGVSFEPPQETAMVRPNQTPVEGVSTELPKGNTAYSSTAGNNVAAYVNKASATLGSDPGAITEAGKIYADRVTQGLKTPDASAVNVQQTEDTAAARRAYLANVQASERIGQSGFAAGSAQATRIADQSQAGVNAANQAGQSSANEYLRRRTEDNMNRAQGLETQQYNRNRTNLADAQALDEQGYNRNERTIDRTLAADQTAYNRGRDAVADTRYERTYADSRGDKALENSRWDTLNAQQQTQLAFENAQVVKNGTDAEKRNLINSLPDGPAKNAVMAGLASGSMTTADALSKVMNPDGSIKEEYRGKTPGALGLEGEKEYAIQTLQLEDPAFDPTSPEGVRKIAAKVLELRKTKESPITDATKAAVVTAASEKLKTGTELTPEETDALIKAGEIQSYGNISAFPTDERTAKALVGKPVRIGTTDYQVASTGSVVTSRTATNQPRHTDYVVLKGEDGKVVYAWSGTLHNAPPKEGEAARLGFLTTE